MMASPRGRRSLGRDEGQEEPRRLPDTEIFYLMPEASDTAIVAFGAGGGGEAHFEYFKALRPLPGFAKLLVRDPAGRKGWYNNGLPGVGDTVDEIAAAIEQQLSKLGASRVVVAGSSMGGYGAILFGCLIGVERVIALGPQTILDSRLGKHGPPPGTDLQVPDLKPVIEAAPNVKIELVAGWDDPRDVFQAQRVAELPSVRVLALRGGVHGFVEDLQRQGELMSFLTELIEGRTPERCEVEPRLDPELYQRLADTAYAMQRQDWKSVVERVGLVAERHPDWAGPSFELGRALAGLGDWESAEAHLARAVRANPRRAAGHLLLARCLMQLGRAEEARAAAHHATDLDPNLSESAERLIARPA